MSFDEERLAGHQAVTAPRHHLQEVLITDGTLKEVKPDLFAQRLDAELNAVLLPALLQLSEELRPLPHPFT